MVTQFERHDVNFEKQEYKCFKYLCDNKSISVSEGIRILVQTSLKEKGNVEVILISMEKQKQAIEKRSKK